MRQAVDNMRMNVDSYGMGCFVVWVPPFAYNVICLNSMLAQLTGVVFWCFDPHSTQTCAF